MRQTTPESTPRELSHEIAAMRLSRGDLLLAALFAAACFALRATSAVVLSLSADEGVVGLMSLDLLRGKAPSIYWYGQHYMGTFENILAAPAVFLFGPTTFAVRLPSVLGSAACVFMAFVYLRRRFSRAAGVMAALLLTVSPAFFHDINMRARGGYGVTLPLIMGLLLVAGAMGRGTFSRSFLFGALAGFSFWTNPQTIEVSMPLVVWLFLFRRSWRMAAGVAAGALVGLLPPLVYLHQTGIFVQTPPSDLAGAVASVTRLPRRALSVLGGETAGLAVKAAVGSMVGLFLAGGVVLYTLLRRRLRGGGACALDALAFTPVVAAGVLAVGGAWAPERYFYLAYLALAMVAAAGWSLLGWRRIAGVFCALTLAACAVTLVFHHAERPQDSEYLSNDEYAAVLEYLGDAGTTAVVTDYGADYALMYLSGLKVKALPVPLGGRWTTRWRDAAREVSEASDFAVVLYDQPTHERLKDHMKPAVFEEFLAETSRSAQVHSIGRITVYTKISSMSIASGLEEYGRWVMLRYPHLSELTPQLTSSLLAVE